MRDKILMIVPSRGRPGNINQLIASWISTISAKCDLLIGLDQDDPLASSYMCMQQIKGIEIQINPRLRLGGTLNLLAVQNMYKYKYLGFMGDDHRFRTECWDQHMITTLEDMDGVGIVYGNDLLRGEELPTACVMTSNIVRQLGYMVPPHLIHLYLDNFWLDLGNAIDKLCYLPEVIIEHMHFTAGKSEHDELYASVNNNEVMSHDAEVYEEYLNKQWPTDIKKLEQLTNGI